MSGNSIKKNILTLVKARPQVMDSYNELIVSYWIVFDKVNRLADIPKATPAESIRRRFQQLAEDGLIQVPRRLLAKEMQNTRREYDHEFKSLL